MPLGWQETIFIFILALLVFGPKKLPELGKTIGKAMTEFRRASSELKSTWDREMAQIEREGESVKDVARQVNNDISSTYNPSDNYSYYDSGYENGYGADSGTYTAPASSTPSTVGEPATQGAEQTAQVAETPAAPASDGAPEAVVTAEAQPASPEAAKATQS